MIFQCFWYFILTKIDLKSSTFPSWLKQSHVTFFIVGLIRSAITTNESPLFVRFCNWKQEKWVFFSNKTEKQKFVFGPVSLVVCKRDFQYFSAILCCRLRIRSRSCEVFSDRSAFFPFKFQSWKNKWKTNGFLFVDEFRDFFTFSNKITDRQENNVERRHEEIFFFVFFH